ncbi:MOG interacting and ectopic P-granules protein 1-like [Battus philenor]|uniref:MOG interacting and ectopic P-granules protein 1-like n=1 Tax=Battus philenor TaxID=42288 RepID=UPI0035D0E902
MNGVVNGAMDEPLEHSLPTSPKSKNIEAEISHGKEENNHENDDHQESQIIEGTECPVNDQDNNSDKLRDEIIPNNENESCSLQNSKYVPQENHCINSNKLNAGSLHNSQTKKTEQEKGSILEKIQGIINLSMGNKQMESPFDPASEEDSLVGEDECYEVSEGQNAKHVDSPKLDLHNGDHNDDNEDHSVEHDNDQNEDHNDDNIKEDSIHDHNQKSEIKKNINKIHLIKNQDKDSNQNGSIQGSPSPEQEEIVGEKEECATEVNVKKIIPEVKVQLRRSSRAIKRKRYDDDVENGDDISDTEVMSMEHLRRKPRPIVINDTKTLVQMAARQMRAGHVGHQKKEPTVVIIDTNSVGSSKPTPFKNSIHSFSPNAHHLYQSIVARGTTVTPISSKTNSTPRTSSSSPQPSTNQHILPSLTDDMFVVEAPSFIVPYVYEKPSLKPFREFVDTLGKQLEKLSNEEKSDNEENKVEKESLPDNDQSEDQDQKEIIKEQNDKVEEVKKKNVDGKRERKKPRNIVDDDSSWDGESTTDSDDELGSDDEEKTVVLKVKSDLNEDLKNVTGLTVEKVVTGKSDNYFDCSLGKFFMDIGLNLVQEFVQNDLLKQQNRKLHREKKGGHNTRATESSIISLTKNLEFSKENNAPYRHKLKKCSLCSFKSESELVLSHHLETPHMKNNVYKCNYCTFEIRSPHDILHHMEAAHNIRGKLERAPAYHQCANCPFEDNGKGKLARHLIPCSKKFKPELNLAPPVEWEPPAKIPKITRSRNNMMGTYQSAFNRASMNALRAGTVSSAGGPAVASSAGCVNVGGSYRMRGRSPLATAPRAGPVHGAPMLRGGIMIRHNTPALLPSGFPVSNNAKNVATIKSSTHQPSISITPLPRQPQPSQPQPAHQSKSSFVICEICDGYIKDLEQLRNHMQWIHKVKIHPKMIYNRPPLNCQKCQCRFFTDQGLERHLLGSHGLVTSSMQEASNKGKDAGRCPVCGRVYQWKLLNHVTRDHNLVLKPAHLSYKCTVCTATFGMYKQFENHVYSAHSVVAKRVMDKSKVAPNKSNDSLLKPLKINDEITIIPQPVKPSTAGKEK